MVKVAAAVGFIALVGVAVYMAMPSNWDRALPIAIAIHSEGDSEYVTVLDPENDTMTTLVIPDNTQITATNQLGTWTLGSLWKLGEQEGIGGRLMAGSITKTFGVPITAWASEDILTFRGIVDAGDTNLSLKDRVKVWLFTTQVNPAARKEIRLADTTVLREQKLQSGEIGYVVRDRSNSLVTSIFSVSKVSAEAARVEVLDNSGGYAAIDTVSKITDVLGAKVASVKAVDASVKDCLVTGSDTSVTANVLANILGCERSYGDTESVFNVTITLGEEFAKRF